MEKQLEEDVARLKTILEEDSPSSHIHRMTSKINNHPDVMEKATL
jgi:hypothetical protein